MKKVYICLCAVIMSTCLMAQKSINEVEYRRSSLYSVLMYHTEQTHGWRVKMMFLDLPTPDKYNDHNLSVRVIGVDNKLKHKEKGEDFLKNNQVASHLVARWFNRNPYTGVCNTDLVRERGLYNASEIDKAIATQTIRGNALLEDAGEELIQNTFVLISEAKYFDKEKQGEIAGIIMAIFGAAAQGIAGGMGYNTGNQNWGSAMYDVMSTLKGFRIQMTTHLYRLKWDEETANTFYTMMYTTTPNETKRKYFEDHRDLFQLEYIGTQVSDGKEVSFLGVNLDTPDEMFKKACARALDENIANLQKNFEVFKVKSPLTNINPIQVPIGKKEEISENSLFEVLEPSLNESGKMTYRRVAVIQPIKGMIWDNRFMAEKEMAAGASLGYTTFKLVSGGNLVPGLLVREIK